MAQVDYHALMQLFFAERKQDLYSFVMQQVLPKKWGFADRVNLYCQLALLYEEQLTFTVHVQTDREITYALVYAK